MPRNKGNIGKMQGKIPVGVQTSPHELMQHNKVLSIVALKHLKARNKLFMLLYAENQNHWAFQPKYLKTFFHDPAEAEALIEEVKKLGTKNFKEGPG